MKVKERHFPYPILADFSNDYTQSSYETSITYDVTSEEFILYVKHSLDNRELEELIANKKAKYCVHIECPKTQTRFLEATQKNKQHLRVKASNIEKNLEVCTFIAANEDIIDYNNQNFDADYKGYSFNLKKGDIIAIGFDYNISIEKDKINESESILQLEKGNENTKEAFKITYNTDRIVVKLNPQNYTLYNNLADQDELQSVLHSLIGVPVLTSALQVVAQEMEDETEIDEGVSGFRWFRILIEKIKAIGLDPYDATIYEETVSLAQKILNDPFSKSLEALNNYNDDYDGDGDEDEEI